MNEQREHVLSSIVTNIGELNAAKLIARQHLYTGRNGKVIERFWVDIDGQSKSFIFKPLTNGTKCGRERWMYEHLLDSVPVRIPKLYAVAEHEDPEFYWTIYEDMGELSHHLEEDDYIIAAASIPLWHRLPLYRVPSHFKGDKRDLTDLIQEVMDGYDDVKICLTKFGLEEAQITAIKRFLTLFDGNFESEMVISHGDYHQGNVCRRGAEFIILDWEFVHHNSVYWDLYCLLDMSHPDFPKMVSSSTRLAALQAYVNHRVSLGWEAAIDVEAFFRDYHRYAIILSLWMLGLIEHDLQNGQWEMSKLLRSQHETMHSLMDCFAYCHET